MRVVAAFLAVVPVVVLSGCDMEMFQGPVSVKQLQGRLLVTVCAEGEVTSINALTRGVDTDRAWVTFWVGHVDLSLARGDEFLGGAREGIAFGRFSEPKISAGTEIDISFSGSDGAIASAVLKAPEEGLPTQKWLRSDGSIDSEPCLY